MLSYSPVAAKAAVATPSSMARADRLRMEMVMVVSLGIVVVGSSSSLGVLRTVALRCRNGMPRSYHRYELIVGQALTHYRYLSGGKRGGNGQRSRRRMDSGDFSPIGMAIIPTSAGIEASAWAKFKVPTRRNAMIRAPSCPPWRQLVLLGFAARSRRRRRTPEFPAPAVRRPRPPRPRVGSTIVAPWGLPKGKR